MNNMAKISTTLLLIIVVAGSSITVLATQNKDDKMTSPLYDIRTTQAITNENQDIIMRHVGSDRSVSDFGFTINSESGNYRSGNDGPDTNEPTLNHPDCQDPDPPTLAGTTCHHDCPYPVPPTLKCGKELVVQYGR